MECPDEEIPGVITTTTSAIHNFLKKTKAQDLINWEEKTLSGS
jgi:NADH-quinone oxidoreductase subunit B